MPAPIQVRSYGSSGPPVVVLHGGPGAPGSVAALARALTGSFRALEPLQRRAGGAPLTVAQHVQDLAEVAPPRALVVGWSWGAMLGLSFAARWPGRVAGLALVGCGTYDEASRAAYRRAVDARLGADGLARRSALDARLAAAATQAERDEVLGAIGALYVRAQSVDPLPLDEHAATDALPADAAGHEQTWSDALRLQREGVEPAAFRAVRAPVVMLHGDDDPHPGPSTRDTLRAFVPHLEYVALPRCGHEPWRERGARGPFLVALSSWLERVAAGEIA